MVPKLEGLLAGICIVKSLGGCFIFVEKLHGYYRQEASVVALDYYLRTAEDAKYPGGVPESVSRGKNVILEEGEAERERDMYKYIYILFVFVTLVAPDGGPDGAPACAPKGCSSATKFCPPAT